MEVDAARRDSPPDAINVNRMVPLWSSFPGINKVGA